MNLFHSSSQSHRTRYIIVSLIITLSAFYIVRISIYNWCIQYFYFVSMMYDGWEVVSCGIKDRKKLSCHLRWRKSKQDDRARDDQRILEDLKNLLRSFHGVVLIVIWLAFFWSEKYVQILENIAGDFGFEAYIVATIFLYNRKQVER